MLLEIAHHHTTEHNFYSTDVSLEPFLLFQGLIFNLTEKHWNLTQKSSKHSLKSDPKANPNGCVKWIL